eukprot:COSAG02_NODE_109_length_36250_cov_121.168903_3_plen_108_part_00
MQEAALQEQISLRKLSQKQREAYFKRKKQKEHATGGKNKAQHMTVQQHEVRTTKDSICNYLIIFFIVTSVRSRSLPKLTLRLPKQTLRRGCAFAAAKHGRCSRSQQT